MIPVQLAPNSAVIAERHERKRNLYFLKAITQFRTTISHSLCPSPLPRKPLKRPQLGNRPIIHLLEVFAAAEEEEEWEDVFPMERYEQSDSGHHTSHDFVSTQLLCAIERKRRFQFAALMQNLIGIYNIFINNLGSQSHFHLNRGHR